MGATVGVNRCWRGALRLAQCDVPCWRCEKGEYARVGQIFQKLQILQIQQLLYAGALAVYKMSTAVSSSSSLQLWIIGPCAARTLGAGTRSALQRTSNLIGMQPQLVRCLSLSLNTIITIAPSPHVRSNAFSSAADTDRHWTPEPVRKEPSPRTFARWHSRW